jgi:hypothetical protein
LCTSVNHFKTKHTLKQTILYLEIEARTCGLAVDSHNHCTVCSIISCTTFLYFKNVDSSLALQQLVYWSGLSWLLKNLPDVKLWEENCICCQIRQKIQWCKPLPSHYPSVEHEKVFPTQFLIALECWVLNAALQSSEKNSIIQTVTTLIMIINVVTINVSTIYTHILPIKIFMQWKFLPRQKLNPDF